METLSPLLQADGEANKNYFDTLCFSFSPVSLYLWVNLISSIYEAEIFPHCFELPSALTNELFCNEVYHFVQKGKIGSSCCGSVETNLTSSHEDAGLIPDPSQ